jgi:molybdopterin molybdotransferase
MISVEEAVTRVIAAFQPLPAEKVALAKAVGRALAEDAVARVNQPPHDVSAMDGYALRAADAAKPGAMLRVIGTAPAGRPFAGEVGNGEAVRLFTGSVVPKGADAIIIQENAKAKDDSVTFSVAATSGEHIRQAGLDFRADDVLVAKGKRLSPRDLALLAAADIARVAVRRKPRIAFAATGDELSKPGEPRKPGGIVASSGYGLSALISQWGGEPKDLGILPDSEEAIAGIAQAAGDADLIVTLGGASVGDYDLVQRALGPKGFALDFWKIAMRPGKPLIFGRLGTTPLLGLPGNPVSTLVCAYLFLRPAIAAMLGVPAQDNTVSARLTRTLKANDARQDYVRARMFLRDGQYFVEPFPVQDSSMMRVFAQADALIVRGSNAPAAQAGERVDAIPLDR